MTQVQTQRVVRLDGSSQLVEVPDPAPAVIGAPTATDYGGVKLGAAIAAPAAMTATKDTASSASDVAGLLVDHNDLVTNITRCWMTLQRCAPRWHQFWRN